MSLFAIIFAVLILSLFWGGFGFTMMVLLKLKSKPGPDE